MRVERLLWPLPVRQNFSLVVVVGRTEESVAVGHDLQHAFALDLAGEVVLRDHLVVERLDGGRSRGFPVHGLRCGRNPLRGRLLRLRLSLGLASAAFRLRSGLRLLRRPRRCGSGRFGSRSDGLGRCRTGSGSGLLHRQLGLFGRCGAGALHRALALGQPRPAAARFAHLGRRSRIPGGVPGRFRCRDIRIVRGGSLRSGGRFRDLFH